MCVCKKNLNFSFFIEALYANCEGFPYDYKIFLSQMCCNVDNENCMLNNCSGCQFDSQVFLSTDINLQASMPVQQWKNVDGFLQVVEENISVIDVIAQTQTLLRKKSSKQLFRSLQKYGRKRGYCCSN